MKWVGDGGDIGGEDLGDEDIDCGDAEGDKAGEDGGDTEAKRPVRLKSSGFVDKFSGSSETRGKCSLVNKVGIQFQKFKS